MRYQLLIAIFLIGFNLSGQEFQADVTINTVSGNFISDPQVFKSLEVSAEEFLNRTKWTNDEFRANEKIKVALQFNIETEPVANSFTAEIIVKSFRPVFNSSYNSQMLNIVDKNVIFSFNVGQIIQKSDAAYFDNLSSLLTFYSYIILGYDYDSFSLYGGDPHFQSANEVRNALPQSIRAGQEWSNDISITRNKYYMVNDMLDPRVRNYRSFVYRYHREILDNMHSDPDKQRAVLASSITDLNSVNSVYPNSMVLNMFCDAKRNEIIEIFKVADSNQKKRVYDMILSINPTLSQVMAPIAK
jgi:hypothetical protein